MSIDSTLYKFQNDAFNAVLYITWTLYIIILLGVSANAPQYLSTLHYYVKIYVSLFLIYRFRPFRTVKFTPLDARIAFSAGIFLLGTTIIGDSMIKYYNQIKSYLIIFKITH